MYEVRSAGLKGLGVFANRHISRGTRIISEKPLLALTHADSSARALFAQAERLAESERQTLLDLSCYDGVGIGRLGRWASVFSWTMRRALLGRDGGPGSLSLSLSRSLKRNLRILSVFRSNSFCLSTGEVAFALFPGIARLNHSCVPNAQANFHEPLGTFNVHAIRDIAEGEEVCLSYLAENGEVSGVRRRKLEEGYGFVCGCVACDLSTRHGKEGEESRLRMQRRLAEFAARRAGSLPTLDFETGLVIEEKGSEDGGKEERKDGDAEEELENTLAFIEMLEQERIAGRELATMYYSVAEMYEKSGRSEEAVKSAERGVEIDRDCLGEDHPLYGEAEAFVARLRGR